VELAMSLLGARWTDYERRYLRANRPEDEEAALED
jgi:hypothetical protein